MKGGQGMDYTGSTGTMKEGQGMELEYWYHEGRSRYRTKELGTMKGGQGMDYTGSTGTMKGGQGMELEYWYHEGRSRYGTKELGTMKGGQGMELKNLVVPCEGCFQRDTGIAK